MPSRVCSTAQCCAALTYSAVSRASRLTPAGRRPRHRCRLRHSALVGRAGEAADAVRERPATPCSGEKWPSDVCTLAFCSHKVSSCATFSSSVMRAEQVFDPPFDRLARVLVERPRLLRSGWRRSRQCQAGSPPPAADASARMFVLPSDHDGSANLAAAHSRSIGLGCICAGRSRSAAATRGWVNGEAEPPQTRRNHHRGRGRAPPACRR